jgi:hypothetical protein
MGQESLLLLGRAWEINAGRNVAARRPSLAARAWLREAVKHAAVPDNLESLGRALEALAAVTVNAGEPEHAATLFGAADGVRRSIGAASG